MARDKLIKPRRGTLAEWAAAEASAAVLASGEMGYITDTRDWVVGDGTTKVASLPRSGSSTYAGLAGATFAGSVQFSGRRPWIDPMGLGAVADGSSHPLSTRFASLVEAQAVYPHATALTQELDWAALQLSLNNIPVSTAVDGGMIVIYGDYFLGADGLASTRPNVWLLGLAAPSHGTGGAPTARISGSGSGQILLDIGSASVTNHRGWRIDNIVFRDVSAGGDQLAGGVRLRRTNFSRFTNCDWQNIKAGYAVQLDGTGDTCQYTEFFACRARQVLHGIQAVTGADDTVIHGGSFSGTAAAGGVGVTLLSSMRLIGTNIQGFETGVTLDGNNPCATDLRGDLSAGAVAQHVRILGTAADARVVNAMFGGTAPSTDYIVVDSGAIRTRILIPSTNTATTGVTDNGTDTRVSGLSGALLVSTSQASVSNTNVETALATTTIPGGMIRPGTTFGWRLSGQVDNIATSGTLTVRLKIGSVTVGQTAFASGAGATTNRGTVIHGRCTFRTSGPAATWAAEQVGHGGPGTTLQTLAYSATSGSTIATNVSQTVTITAAWATADAGNILRIETAQVELLKP